MPKKIFELAKELGLGPLDLVEDLKNKGYTVRNHMTALSDEDVEKILAGFKKASTEEAGAKKKTTKKKVAKKKVAKKKVTKKVAAKSDGASSDEGEKEKPKTVTRRKTVIRKKSSAQEEVVEKVEAAEVEVEAKVEVQETINEPEVTTEEVSAEPVSEDDNSSGLRVVKKAPTKKAEVAPVENTEAPVEAKEAKDSNEIYREKVHKFTPVYIPPKEEKKEESEESKPKASSTGNANKPAQSATSQSAPAGNESGAKKRMGGLASMMSGKKTNVNKAQIITQTRADSEMKSYGAISGTGRPLYTQVKRKRIYSGPSAKTNLTEVKDAKRVVKLHNGALAEQLAKKLSVKLKDMIDACLDINLLVKNGDYIGMNLASQIAAMYSYRVEDVSFDEEKVLGTEAVEDKSHLPLRNPIITIMGHVDHGKTTLLDHIRAAKVADGEAGGITQHIGAYSVETKSKKTLTFLDTPGHAAFASMRQRGADVTDIVVLVVAADDGVMPQTKESIRFCQNSDKPMIIAVNKMDKEGVNPDRIKQELTEFEITPEEWGGDTQFVPISALKGDGIDDLLESIALQAEMLDLREDPKGKAEGIVIESKIEAGRGPVATVLVQKGTLKKGDSIVVGETFGRARSLTDSLGATLTNAGPSTPVQILGLQDAPSPGDSLNIVKSEREAKKVVQNRIDERKKLASEPTQKKMSLEDFFATAASETQEKKDLNLIIRSDVQGSFEAIKQAVEALGNKEVNVRVIAGGVGAISDSDINLADSASAFVFGFNMRPVTSARRLAEDKGVDIKTYSIIYELINDVTLAIEGLLDPDTIEEFIGRAEVRETFNVPRIGTIAGSYVIDGKIKTGCGIRLLRNGKIMHDGDLSSLKRFKDDAKEVKNGFECGIGLKEYNDIKVGDIFEAYMMIEKKRTLEDVAKEEEVAAKEAEEARALAELEETQDSADA